MWRVAARKAREGWKKTKGYLSEDPLKHRTGAAQRMDELSREIADVKARSTETTVGRRPHFLTRLLALTQQHDHVCGELAKLSNLKSQSGYGAARKASTKAWIFSNERSISPRTNCAAMDSD